MHRFFNRKRIAALGVAVLLGGGATGAFAYMYASATGSSSVQGTQISTLATVPVTLSGVSAPTGYYANAGSTAGSCANSLNSGQTLLPGDCVAYSSVTIQNTSTTETVQVKSLALATWSSSASSTCNPTLDPGLFSMTQSVVPSGGLTIPGNGTSSPGGLAFTMANTSQNDAACAGTTITFTVSAS
jgi:hypothetical protein